MKKVIISLMVLSVIFFSACNKNKKKIQNNLKGYIYNSNDSTPFKNTTFKYYYPNRSSFANSESLEHFFTTNEKGYFDFTTEQYQGQLVWPSYHEGAAYVGPEHFGPAKDFIQDNENGIYTYIYDTLYTTPYR